MIHHVDEALHTLREHEEKVLRLRLGLNEGTIHALEEVGQIFNCTRENIRHIQVRALHKLLLRSENRRCCFHWYLMPPEEIAGQRLEELFSEPVPTIAIATPTPRTLSSEETAAILNAKLDTKIKYLEFSARTANGLRYGKILTVRGLITKTEPELLRFKNFGRKSLNEVKEALEIMGLSLGMHLDEASGKWIYLYGHL